MKAEITTILLFILWVLLGIIYPIINIFFSFLFFPLLFLLVEISQKYRLNFWKVPILMIFLLIVNDYFIQFHSNGTNDQVGQALSEISFYASLISSILAVIIIEIIRGKLVMKMIFYYLSYLIILIISSVLLYNFLYDSQLFQVKNYLSSKPLF